MISPINFIMDIKYTLDYIKVKIIDKLDNKKLALHKGLMYNNYIINRRKKWMQLILFLSLNQIKETK